MPAAKRVEFATDVRPLRQFPVKLLHGGLGMIADMYSSFAVTSYKSQSGNGRQREAIVTSLPGLKTAIRVEPAQAAAASTTSRGSHLRFSGWK